MPEPESARAALVSGSLSLFAHLAVVGFLALSAWFAPDVVDEIIPVQIIRDAPPPPAPRKISIPRRSVARARVPTSAPRPTAVARPATQQVAARAVQQANIRPTAAPTQIAQRKVTSQRVVAQRTISSQHASAVQVAAVAVTTTGATDLNAPVIDVSGPRVVAPTAAVDVTTPQAFSNYTDSDSVQYSEAATVAASGVDLPSGVVGFALDADLVDGAQHYGTAGGTGIEGDSVPCMQRAEVVHYYTEFVQKRTEAEWQHLDLGDSDAVDESVRLHFILDESGSASSVKVDAAPSKALGESCKQALIAASPFPSMREDVRCMAGRKLKATFKIPAAGAASP